MWFRNIRNNCSLTRFIFRATAALWLALFSVALLLITGCSDSSQGQAEKTAQAKQWKNPPVVEEGNFPVKRIEYAKASSQGSKIYWIDNERVIFSGCPISELIPALKPSCKEKSLYIWDTANNLVEIVKRNIAGFGCYDEGYVRYSSWKSDGEKTYLEIFGGQLGKEKLKLQKEKIEDFKIYEKTYQESGKEKVVVLREKVPDGYHYEEAFRAEGYVNKLPKNIDRSKFACNKTVNKKPSEFLPNRYFIPLLPGHGWLDMGFSEEQLKKRNPALQGAPTLADAARVGLKKPKSKGSAREARYAQQIKLWKPGAKEGIPLIKPDGKPLTGFDVGRRTTITYVQHLDQYVLSGAVGVFENYVIDLYGSSVKKSKSPSQYPFYGLNPRTGHVEKWLQSFGTAGGLLPTSAGLLMGWRLRTPDGREINVLPGVTNYTQRALSPDGCKVAQTVRWPEDTHYRGKLEVGPKKLTVINLCEQGV